MLHFRSSKTVSTVFCLRVASGMQKVNFFGHFPDLSSTALLKLSYFSALHWKGRSVRHTEIKGACDWSSLTIVPDWWVASKSRLHCDGWRSKVAFPQKEGSCAMNGGLNYSRSINSKLEFLYWIYGVSSITIVSDFFCTLIEDIFHTCCLIATSQKPIVVHGYEVAWKISKHTWTRESKSNQISSQLIYFSVKESKKGVGFVHKIDHGKRVNLIVPSHTLQLRARNWQTAIISTACTN